MRCLKHHIANEIHAALLTPATDNPAGHELRTQRQQIGILAATLSVPYQRLRKLEIGTRADPELEQHATLAQPSSAPRSPLDNNRSIHSAGHCSFTRKKAASNPGRFISKASINSMAVTSPLAMINRRSAERVGRKRRMARNNVFM